MNILILTGKFGYGHISAANSIKEKLEKENPEYNIKIVDFIDYMFPYLSKIIYKGFNILVNKFSRVYNLLNLIASKNTNVPLKKVIIKKIDDLFFCNNIDLVISVLPICSQYISAYKKMTNSNIPLYTFITDVYVHNEWIAENTNKYFVPSKETKKELLEKNISEDKIIISGIPVREEFDQEHKNTNKTNILIMGGGLGLIPNIDKFLSKLDTKDIEITVITGNNKKLYNKLNNKYTNIKVLGFTNEVEKYMSDASIIITKAGGITLFESINSLTPMFIIKPFLMQEVGNANYIENNKIGEVIWNNKDNIYNKIIDLINDKDKLNTMQKNMKRLKHEFKKTNINNEIKKMIIC